MTVLYPVILVMEVIIRLFARGKKVHKMTEGEFESFIDLGKDTGTLEHDEHEKIMNILEFGDITAEEIMTPRVKIEAISMETTVKEAMEYYLSHTHSRIPIYDGMIDKIDYFITARDIIFAFKRGELEKKMSDLKLKTVIKIPLNQPISKVMETFQNAHKVMGIVLDEYGGVAGLVTMEDILEEVFGEIRDETDKEVDEIQESSENTYTVDPWVLIEDILDEMELELEDIGLDEKEFDGETVSYIITHELERFPEAGEVVVFAMKEGGKIEFKVTTVEDGKIGMIEVKKLES
ncbi:MAG: CBS domain-containing protein [Candidatus Peribacteria bacterium]|nr:MAG: CBS domain-containing protein [Candidatus Peribacteria bacterium]